MTPIAEIPLQKFHPYIDSDPKSKGDELFKKAHLLNIFSKISLVAIIVISIAANFLPFVLSSISINLYASLFCAVIATPFLAWKSAELQNQKFAIEECASECIAIAQMLDSLKKDPSALQNFRNERNASVPSRALLPVLAQFMVKWQESEDFVAKATNLRERASNIKNQFLRISQREYAGYLLKEKALPAKINAVFALHVLQNPTFQGMPSDYFEVINTQRISDSYLILREDNNFYLGFETLKEIQDPEKLRSILFENLSWKSHNLALGPESL